MGFSLGLSTGRQSFALKDVLFTCLVAMDFGVLPLRGASQPAGVADRAGILELDPETGSASMYIPLGPGLGRPGLRYIPALLGRFAPRVEMRPRCELSLPSTAGFELSPGSLDLRLAPAGSNECHTTKLLARWTYPDGSGASAVADSPDEAHPEAILRRFGYAPSVALGSMPRLVSSAPVGFLLVGTGGESLVALSDETRFPVHRLPGLDGNGKADQWLVPSCVLAVQGDLAFEFQYADGPRTDSSHAHYRLTAIRSVAGDALTFTYGFNGVDFEAAWEGTRLRIALDGMAATTPVPALDVPRETPSSAFRDVEARLRITYEGPEPIPGCTVTALARPEWMLPEGSLAAEGQADPDSFRRNLQVVMVQGDAGGERIRFGYGRALAVCHAGPAGTRHFTPTVLEKIILPQRSIQLEWADQPLQRPAAEPSNGALNGNGVLGVTALHEWDDRNEATEKRTTYRRGTEASHQMPSRTKGAPWVRQSRHFARGLGAQEGVTCMTYTRDRWQLRMTRTASPGADDEETQHRIPYDDDGDIPTFELDAQTSALVPVPGQLTRWLNWDPSLGQPPDPHGVSPPWGSRIGLKGGMPGPRVWPGPITYNPKLHEVTMGAIAGPFPTAGGSGVSFGPNAPGRQAGTIMGQQIAQNLQATRETAQRAAVAMQAGQQAALAAGQAMQAQQARQQATFLAMDRQAKSLQQRLQPPEVVPLARHPANQTGINALHPLTRTMQGKPGDVLVLIWDWQGAGVAGAGHSVGHAASAIKDPNSQWTIVQSQFPHEPGGPSALRGPNILISQPNVLLREEGGRRPNSAYLITVPDLGAFAGAGIADLQKTGWFLGPSLLEDTTNCTYGIIQSLRAGGVPLTAMWCNQTLIIPGTPYTPRDLRTALERDAPFNVIHPFKIHHQNHLINEINWER